MAEYCAIGGKITKRVWAPLGEKDYSSYISQIPDDVDGLYVGIGGSGLISFIKQYKQQKGKVDTERMMGNVFWDDPLVLKEVGKDLVGGTTSAMTAADSDAPEVKAYIENLKTSYGDEIAGGGPSVFTYGYYTAGRALVKGLEAVNGDIADQAKLQEALASTELSGEEAPWGDVTLDDNRQAISDVFVKKIVADKSGDGVPDVQTFARIPEVDQTFGGVFSADTPPPDRENPKCEKGTTAAVGRQRREGQLRQVAPHGSTRDIRRGAPSRSSACGGSAGASAASSPSPGWTSRSAPGSGARSSAPTGPGRPRCST